MQHLPLYPGLHRVPTSLFCGSGAFFSLLNKVLWEHGGGGGCLPAGLACSLVRTSCLFAAICTGLLQQMELWSSQLLQTATRLGLSTFPQPAAAALAITPVSLGLL